MSKVLVIVGSTRPGRAADLVVPWVTPEYNHSIPAVLKNGHD